jgi:hypothetical protein
VTAAARRGPVRQLAASSPGLLAALACFCEYVRTLPPGLADHDFGEMQFEARVLGLPHASGYPLYIWLGHLFELLPVGSIPYRLNLFSAFFGAVAVFLVFAIVVRVVGSTWGARLGAAAAALALGLGYTSWSIATFAQMYTLHVAMALAVVWLALRFQETRSDRWLAGALFTYGAMFGNHLCALSLAPGLGLFVVLTAPRSLLTWRRPVIALVAFAAGVLLCDVLLFWLLWRRHLPWDHMNAAILPNRDLYPFVGQGDSFWRCWWFDASTKQFQYQMSAGSEWSRLQLRGLPHRLVGELFPLGVAGSLVGFGLLWRRNWRLGVLLLALFATQALLNAGFDGWKVRYYFATPYACAAIWLGVLLAWVGQRLERAARSGPSRWPLPLRAAAFTGLFGAELATHAYASAALVDPYKAWLEKIDPKSLELVAPNLGARPDHSHDAGAEWHARDLCAHIEDGSLVYANWDQLYPLLYVAIVEGLRPNLTAQENYPAPGGWGFSEARQRFVREQLQHRSVYLQGNPDGARGTGYDLTEIAPGLWQFRATPPEATARVSAAR